MNQGGINLKTIIVIVIMLLVGVLGVLGISATRTYLSGAATGAEPKGVISSPAEDGKTSVVSWQSDKAAQGVVEYGTTPASLLLRSLETDATTSHRVTLSSLKPNTSYYFRIRVGEEVFDNSGIPYSFKTKGSAATTSTAPAPTVALVPTTAPAETLPTGVGGCTRTTDYDKNGVVNTIDYLKCVKEGLGGKTTTTTTTITPTAPTSSPTAAQSGGQANDCKFGVDYNGDGVVNSVDRISCLQKKSQ